MLLTETIADLFNVAISNSLYDNNIQFNVIPSRYGDYQCNCAIIISKKYNLSARMTAYHIITNFPKSSFIESLQISDTGFINIFLSSKIILQLLNDKKVNTQFNNNKKVIIDMSSPNIAKELHVGHLRSTIIGESLSRLYEYFGFTVLKLNHIGDWGTQVGMVITYLLEYNDNNYKEAKKLFDKNIEFKNKSYDNIIKLQNYDKNITEIWKTVCDNSFTELNKIYERLQIKNLVTRGESFYHKYIVDVVNELSQKGLLIDDNNCKIYNSPGIKTPLIIIKSNGVYTYAATDIAALHHRIFVEKANEILYVVDYGQSLHLESVFSLGRAAGWFDDVIVKHVSFGVVLDENKKKFRTRSGETIKLTDLLDEGIKRSEQKLLKKNKTFSEEEFNEIKKTIAYGCIKYADLSCNRNNNYIFSFDKMLNDKGNTFIYLQYAYARINSIFLNANYNGIINITKLTNVYEWKLAKTILEFDYILKYCFDKLIIHPLCEFLYNLASTFTKYYHTYYVSSNNSSLSLCKLIADIIKTGLYILGINIVDKM